MPKKVVGARIEREKGAFAFVSYAHEDAKVVQSSIAQAKKLGYRFWIDSEIEIGSSWSDEIAEAIAYSAVFIVFISKASLKSTFVRKEIEFAAQKEKVIAPIYLDDINILPPGLELWLGGTQGAVAKNMGSDPISDQIIASLERNGAKKYIPSKSGGKLNIFISIIGLLLIALAAAGTYYIYSGEYKNGEKSPALAAAKIVKPATAKTNVGSGEKKGSENRAKNTAKNAKTAQKTQAAKTIKKEPIANKKPRIALNKKIFKGGEKAAIAIQNYKNVGTIALYKQGDKKPILTKKSNGGKAEIIMPKSEGKYVIKFYGGGKVLSDKTMLASEAVSVKSR